MEREFRYRTNQQSARPPESGERRTHGEDRKSKGADSGDDTLRKAHGRDRIAEGSVGVPARALPTDIPSGYNGGSGGSNRENHAVGGRLSEKNDSELFGTMPGDDRSDESDFRTGWEESRAVYFGLLLGAESGAGQAQRGDGESQETHAQDTDSSLDHGNSSLGAGILSSLPRAGLIEDDSEDEEERRKRIQAEQNGADLGAAIGLAAGLIAQALSSDDDEEEQYEDEQEEPTQQM